MYCQVYDDSRLRTIFVEAAHVAGVKRWHPVFYTGRHTGASLDRLENNISLQEVQRRGR